VSGCYDIKYFYAGCASVSYLLLFVNMAIYFMYAGIAIASGFAVIVVFLVITFGSVGLWLLLQLWVAWRRQIYISLVLIALIAGCIVGAVLVPVFANLQVCSTVKLTNGFFWSGLFLCLAVFLKYIHIAKVKHKEMERDEVKEKLASCCCVCGPTMCGSCCTWHPYFPDHDPFLI